MRSHRPDVRGYGIAHKACAIAWPLLPAPLLVDRATTLVYANAPSLTNLYAPYRIHRPWWLS
jgi:hypothetical protein